MVVTLVFLVSSVVTWGAKPKVQPKSEPKSELEVSLGLMHLTDSDAREVAGYGLGIELRKQISRGPGVSKKSRKDEAKLYASVGYIKFSNSFYGLGVDATVVPIMATAVKIKKNSVYYGAGLGLAMTRLELWGFGPSESASQTDFAYQLMVGKNLGRNKFVEARYFNGGIPGNTGIGVSIGAKF